MKIFFRISLSILISILMLSVHSAHAQSVSRHEVQAAFIHKFIKFIEWPQNSLREDSQTILVGIIGSGQMVNALNGIKGKEVKGLKITVLQISELSDAKSCDVLFISPSEEGRYEEILGAVRGLNILTVGQTKGFAIKGVIINFVLVDNKIRFEINKGAGEEAGLKISSKLLNLATDVIR